MPSADERCGYCGNVESQGLTSAMLAAAAMPTLRP